MTTLEYECVKISRNNFTIKYLGKTLDPYHRVVFDEVNSEFGDFGTICQGLMK